MAKVSLIIPAYNVEPYLVECMESVTRQTLHDLEIICINDGSQDGTLRILQEYAERDSRIIVIDKENGGYGIGMNIGLGKASGEYIGIVEPDDFVPLMMYEDLYQSAKKWDLDFIKADFYRFTRSSEGDMTLFYNHLSPNPQDYNTVFNPSEKPDALRYIMNTWSGIYKRSFLEEYHIRHNETPGASFQDNGFWFQTFIYAKRAMILDHPYYMNRRDNPNSSVSNPQKVYCMNVEYDYIRDILMRDKDLWTRFKGMYWFKKYNNYIATLRRIAPEMLWEYVQRFSAEFRRGLEKNELEKDVFTPFAWGRITLLTSDAEKFYHTVAIPESNKRDPFVVRGSSEVKLNKRIHELEHRLDLVENSTAYKVGRVATLIPRKIKDALKRK